VLAQDCDHNVERIHTGGPPIIALLEHPLKNLHKAGSDELAAYLENIQTSLATAAAFTLNAKLQFSDSFSVQASLTEERRW
jgi:hypothetical protein